MLRLNNLSCLLCFLVLVTVGCSPNNFYSGKSSAAPTPQATPATILFSGVSSLELLGETAQLRSLLQQEDGALTDVTSQATWTVTPTGVMNVSAPGLVKCIKAGAASVRVVAQGVTGSTTFKCDDTATSLTLSRSSVSMRSGVPVQIRASSVTAGGVPVDLSPVISWSTASSIASISPSGTLTCLRSGQTSATANYGSRTASIPVTCNPSSWTSPSYFLEQSAEFVGPFPSWSNVKTAFGAVGDGTADDTVAIQKAFDSIQEFTGPRVLWFPAGVYKISAPLRLTHKSSFSIKAEDPSTTSIKWAGAAGSTMLLCNGSSWFRLSRLTFDGAGIADSAVTMDNDFSAGELYATFNEISDLHIKGTTNGLKLTIAAETSVQRVFFDRLPGYGLKVGDWNTLNIFISDSLFLECGIGITNLDGSGNFIVASSFFARSSVADMAIGNTGYFTARHNTSVSSHAFFTAAPIGANPAQITIQNNTILDPLDKPFQLGNEGPLMLIDNVIRMQDNQLPVVWGFFDRAVKKNVFSAGNTFTSGVTPQSDASDTFQGTVVSYDDVVVPVGSIPDVQVPSNVYTPPNLHRAIFEVQKNASGDSIQNAIISAMASAEQHPVVHIPAGDYPIFSTIIVPPAAHGLQLIGDDSWTTTLYWEGPTFGGPLLSLQAGDATVSDLHLRGDHYSVVDGIDIPVTDQPSTQIMVDQAQLQYDNQYSFRFEGVEHANIELSSAYTLGSVTGIDLAAGAFRQSGLATLGRTNDYSGSMQSSATSTSFNVSNHGKFLVQDNWHDAGLSGPRNFNLTGAGTVTEQSGLVGTLSKVPFAIDNFDGKISLIGLIFDGGFSTNGGSGHTDLMTLGLSGKDPSYLPHSSPGVDVTNVLGDYYTPQLGGVDVAGTTLADVSRVRLMLAQTRSEYPSPRLPMASGLPRARLSRITVQGMKTAVRFYPKTINEYLTYGIDAESSSDASCTNILGQGSQASVQWRLWDGGEGDVVLTDWSGERALGFANAGSASTDLTLTSLDGTPSNGDNSQRWIVEDVGDGRKRFKNRAANSFLVKRNDTCLGLTDQPSIDAAKWVVQAQ